MATLRLNGSVLIVKYLYDNNGSPYYQRRVPHDLVDRFGKTKLAVSLDPDNGAPAIQVQRIAKRHDALFKAFRNDPDLTVSEEKLAALALLDSFGLSQGDAKYRFDPRFHEFAKYDDQPHLSEFQDYLVDMHRDGKLTNIDKLALRALQDPLPVTLSEMPQVYFEHHKRGSEPFWRKKQLQYWEKLVNLLGDIPAESVSREKAREYRAHREAQGLKSQSVQKDLNIVKAIFSVCIRELSLKMTNPFDGLTATAHGMDVEKRLSLTLAELQTVIDSAVRESDDIRRIALACTLTGARIGEVVGLRKQDCKFSGKVPYVSFVEYGVRRLKTRNSIRDVPVLPILLSELKRQITECGDSGALFPRYNDMKSAPRASGASAAVNKWLRETLEIDKTAHCFRHTIMDLLKEAEVTEDLRKEILGHGKQIAADLYGLGSSLSKKLGCLDRVFKLIFTKEY